MHLEAEYILKWNDAIATIASAQKELTEEQEAMEKPEAEHKHGMKLYRKRIERIMCQDIRAFTQACAKVMMFSKQGVRILMVGLEADEKTTILYKLKLGEYVTTIPAIGFNVETVEYENIGVTVRDVGGQD